MPGNPIWVVAAMGYEQRFTLKSVELALADDKLKVFINKIDVQTAYVKKVGRRDVTEREMELRRKNAASVRLVGTDPALKSSSTSHTGALLVIQVVF